MAVATRAAAGAATSAGARVSVREETWSLVLLFLAVNLWAATLFMVDRSALLDLSDLGLAAQLPWPFFGAIAALLVGYALLLRRREPNVALLVAYLVVLILVWHATPAVLYETPRYPFTYKHIGISAYIQLHGSIDPNIDAYFNWPGFFALTALASDLSGLDTPFVEAVFAPVLMNVFIVAGLIVLLRGLSRDWRVVWLGAWLYLLANWVGQDYFAPQAFAYALHLIVLGLYVGYFVTRRWRGSTTVTAAGLQVEPLGTAGPGVKAGLLVFIVVAFAAVVASHQLTPFMTIASVTALMLIGLGRARLLLPIMLGLQLAWFSYMARTYFAGHLESLLASVGRLLENVTIASEVLAPATAAALSPERLLVLDVRQWLTVLVALLAAVGWLSRARARERDWVPVTLALVPAAMVALQPYGGEIIMRIFLFCVPLLAYFSACAFFPTSAPRPRRGTTLAIVLVSALMAAGMAVAYYGNESMNYVAQDELDLLEDLYATAPTGSLIVTQTNNPPTRHTRYEEFTYRTLGEMATAAAPQDGGLSLEELSAAMGDIGGDAAYLLLTRSQTANARLFGYLAELDWEDVRAALNGSPWFETVAENDGGALYLATPAAGTGSARGASEPGVSDDVVPAQDAPEATPGADGEVDR